MVWNSQRIDLVNQYLHPAFRDHSQPFFAVQNTDGFRLYLRTLNKDFIHNTKIVELSQQGCIVTVKINLELQLKNLDFRTGLDASLLMTGVRCFTMRDHQIFDHREQLEIKNEQTMAIHA